MSVIKYGKTFPEFVKRFRLENGLSQADLAYELGVHPQYVSNIERGVTRNCVAFASRLFGVVEKKREPYLIDLISEGAATSASLRRKRKK